MADLDDHDLTDTGTTEATIGVWQPQARQQPIHQSQMTFPSNLANRRSVGQRNGPSYAGPTPLADIFRH